MSKLTNNDMAWSDVTRAKKKRIASMNMCTNSKRQDRFDKQVAHLASEIIHTNGQQAVTEEIRK